MNTATQLYLSHFYRSRVTVRVNTSLAGHLDEWLKLLFPAFPVGGGANPLGAPTYDFARGAPPRFATAKSYGHIGWLIWPQTVPRWSSWRAGSRTRRPCWRCPWAAPPSWSTCRAQPPWCPRPYGRWRSPASWWRGRSERSLREAHPAALRDTKRGTVYTGYPFLRLGLERTGFHWQWC